MGRTCCVKGCSSKSHDGKGIKVNHVARFFTFPTWKKSHGPQTEEISKKRRMAWVAAVRRKNITFAKISPCMYVCSRHFHKGQPAYEMMESDPDWAPSLHMGHTDITHTDTACSARRSMRVRTITLQPLQPAETRAHQPGERYNLEEGTHKAGESDHLEEGTHKAGESGQLNTKDGTHDTHPRAPIECNLCVLRCAEVNRLVEENRELRRELEEYKMHLLYLHT